MAAEEKHLLVAFARVQPEEAATLRAQHAELRQLLAVAGPSLQADGDAWMALTGALRAHASQEDSMFYVWAERTERGAAEGLIRDVSERSGEVDLAQRP